METETQQIEELKQLVRQNIALTEENNKMLHSIRRSAWMSSAFRLLWIAIILGSTIYGFLYIQPYLAQLMDIYGNLQGFQEKASSFFGQPSEGQ